MQERQWRHCLRIFPPLPFPHVIGAHGGEAWRRKRGRASRRVSHVLPRFAYANAAGIVFKPRVRILAEAEMIWTSDGAALSRARANINISIETIRANRYAEITNTRSGETACRLLDPIRWRIFWPPVSCHRDGARRRGMAGDDIFTRARSKKLPTRVNLRGRSIWEPPLLAGLQAELLPVIRRVVCREEHRVLSSESSLSPESARSAPKRRECREISERRSEIRSLALWRFDKRETIPHESRTSRFASSQ